MPVSQPLKSSSNPISLSELRYPPNLLSAVRVLFGPVVLYLLSINTTVATLSTIGLFVLAAVTDALDGYLARRSHRITQLGILLDPLADKLFAAFIIIGLVFFRDFPLWLAGVIIGRDLAILVGGLLLWRGQKTAVPSNLTGKYAFAAIAVLLGSYVIRYSFGITMMTGLVLLLTTASLVSYARVLVMVRKQGKPPVFEDTRPLRLLRIIVTVSLSALYLIRLYIDMLAPQ